jgi:hypothetical protein
MTVTQAIDSIYEVFGIPSNSAAPEIMRRRIFNDLNSAMQLLWSKGHRFLDFYTRREISATILANTYSADLSDDVQSVIGPVRNGTTLLRPIASRGEFDNYHSIYAGSLTALAPGTPQAYFIEALRPSSGADATTLKIYIVPAAAATPIVLNLAVAIKAPTFTTSDYSAGNVNIPIPHNYAETLLLPIARYLACSSLFFADKSKQREPQLKAEYDRALQTLTEAS